MSKNTFLIVLLGIAILLAISNPTLEDHKAKVKELLYKEMDIKQSATVGQDVFEKAGSAIGTSLGMAMADKIIDGAVSRDSYVLFSTTRATWEGDTKIIGIGIMGNVFITKKLNEYNSDSDKLRLEEGEADYQELKEKYNSEDNN